MNGQQRARVARETGDIFGDDGPGHVIFAAGFPAIGPDEIQAMRVLAESVDNVSLASHGRATRTRRRPRAHGAAQRRLPARDVLDPGLRRLCRARSAFRRGR